MADAVGFSRARELKQRAVNALRMFAFDSAISHSLKSLAGSKQVHKILQEEVAILPRLSSSSKNKPCKVAVATNEKEMKLQEEPEDGERLKQQYQISTNSRERSEVPTGEPDGWIKKPELVEKKENRIFIRSRL